MGIRRKARELALQFLFQSEYVDQAAGLDFVEFCRHFEVNKKAVPYAAVLVAGVRERDAEINRLIDAASANWRLARMGKIDRNIIRLAVFELCFQAEVPAGVAINEALDIAKRYGNEEAPAFINGVLDAIKKVVEQDGKG